MKKKKRFFAFIIIVLVIITCGFFIIKSWTTTSYGKLTIKLAVILKAEKFINPNSIKGKSISQIRESIDKDAGKWSTKPIPFSNIRDIKIGISSREIPVRIYTPEGSDKFPIVIYSHGGSWIGGSLDTHDNVCRKLSKNTKAIVVSVGYRLAPENPFPAGLNDMYNVVLWIYKNAEIINGNPEHIAIAGDSAGGNLSAAVSYMLMERKGPDLDCQVLIYPPTNIFEMNSKSWSYFGNDYMLTRENEEKFISLYVPNKEDRRSPYASPLLAKDFKGLPPTLVITGEFDPLRDEGEAYAEKLKEAGVEVISSRYKDVPHGFITMDRMFWEADDAINQISLYLQKKLYED